MVGDASITTNDVSILLPSVVGHPDYFVQNKNFKKRNQRTKRQKKTHDLSPDATRWIMSRKKIPSQQCSLVIVVQPQNDKYEEKYHKAHHRYPNPVHQGKYFIPFLSFCDSNEYNDHIPLSMGFFDSTFHKLKISPKDVTLFQRK
jgi:hypothetical protein